MAFHRAIADLYARLKPLGFDAAFVRSVILPDWWEDRLAEEPANRLTAEMAISRFLGIPLPQLHDPDAELSLSEIVPVRLKTATRDTNACSVRPAIQIALQLAELLSQSVKSLPSFSSHRSAAELRSELLCDSGTATLELLVRKCWDLGIIVAHLHRVPRETGFRKFDGLVVFAGERPCIFLAEKADAPPKLAFHLAHELGHLMLGHVQPGSPLLADENLERIINDDDERAADEFACELLTGNQSPSLQRQYGLTAPKLAQRARDFGARHRVDPGMVALIYGRSADRWAVAEAALKQLGLTRGARAILQSALAERWSDDDLTDTQAHFVEQLVLPEQATA